MLALVSKRDFISFSTFETIDGKHFVVIVCHFESCLQDLVCDLISALFFLWTSLRQNSKKKMSPFRFYFVYSNKFLELEIIFCVH
jgi:hypothetical protein